MIDSREQRRSYIGTLETFYVAERVGKLMSGWEHSAPAPALTEGALQIPEIPVRPSGALGFLCLPFGPSVAAGPNGHQWIP
jgi:hypothetical protein